MLLFALLNTGIQPGIALLDFTGRAGVDHAGILLRGAGVGAITEFGIRLGWKTPGKQQAAGENRRDR